MKLATKLLDHEHTFDPCALTVGFFDGVHLGHQHLFKKLREIQGEKGSSFVVSFSNHPRTVLKPETDIELINTYEHRIRLLQKQGVQHLIMLPFTEKLKETSPDDFIAELLEKLSFTDLILGPDSTIGKNQEGDFELLKLLSKKYAFKLHRLETMRLKTHILSSTLIRKKIKEGDFKLLKELLGRPYSIYSHVERGEQIGKQLGYPTLNLNISNLCLPPFGVYKVKVQKEHGSIKGIANLGFAPTLKNRTTPVLEVHLLDNAQPPAETHLEVIFDQFIRDEQKFSSPDALKKQISKDIEMALKD